jgi:hypothetical protein
MPYAESGHQTLRNVLHSAANCTNHQKNKNIAVFAFKEILIACDISPQCSLLRLMFPGKVCDHSDILSPWCRWM